MIGGPPDESEESYRTILEHAGIAVTGLALMASGKPAVVVGMIEQMA